MREGVSKHLWFCHYWLSSKYKALIREICSFPISRMVKLYKKMKDALDVLDYFTQNDWNVRTPANDNHNPQMHDLE